MENKEEQEQEQKQQKKEIHEMTWTEKDQLKKYLMDTFKRINMNSNGGEINNQSLQFLINSFHSRYPGLFNPDTKVVSESGRSDPEILFVTHTPNTQFINKNRPFITMMDDVSEDTNKITSMKANERKFIEKEIKRVIGGAGSDLPSISYYHFFPNRIASGLQPGRNDYSLFVYFFLKKIQISKPKIVLIASSQIFYNLKMMGPLTLIDGFKPILRIKEDYIELDIPNAPRKYQLFQITHPWVVMKGAKKDKDSWNNKLNLSLDRFKTKEKLNVNEIMKKETKAHFEDIEKKKAKKSGQVKICDDSNIDDEKRQRLEDFEKQKERIKKQKEVEKKEQLIRTGKEFNGNSITDFFSRDDDCDCNNFDFKITKKKKIHIDLTSKSSTKNKNKNKSINRNKNDNKNKKEKEKNDKKKNKNEEDIPKLLSSSQKSITEFVQVKKLKIEE